MNNILQKYNERKFTKGFVTAIIKDDLVIEFINAFVCLDKPLIGCMHDDMKNEEFDIVKSLSEEIYHEGSQVFNIDDSDEDYSAMIYEYKDVKILFIIKQHWSIAIWNE